MRQSVILAVKEFTSLITSSKHYLMSLHRYPSIIAGPKPGQDVINNQSLAHLVVQDFWILKCFQVFSFASKQLFLISSSFLK
jgi:hypothetical protein